MKARKIWTRQASQSIYSKDSFTLVDRSEDDGDLEVNTSGFPVFLPNFHSRCPESVSETTHVLEPVLTLLLTLLS